MKTVLNKEQGLTTRIAVLSLIADCNPETTQPLRKRAAAAWSAHRVQAKAEGNKLQETTPKSGGID
jgi:hypothetical protein